jgi:hypothetical protein
MKYKSALAAALWGLVTVSAGATTISSRFDGGAEGWKTGDVYYASVLSVVGIPTWFAAGGIPGGYIYSEDVAAESAFVAPSIYLGNKLAFYGGSVSFDTFDHVPSDNLPRQATIVLYSGTSSITYGMPGPGKGFTHFLIPLSEGGWTYYKGADNAGSTPVSKSAFRAILSSITGFAVHSDWHTGADQTGLDNVVLTGPSTRAVPEPATWAAMTLGFGLLGRALRRRRRHPYLA